MLARTVRQMQVTVIISWVRWLRCPQVFIITVITTQSLTLNRNQNRRNNSVSTQTIGSIMRVRSNCAAWFTCMEKLYRRCMTWREQGFIPLAIRTSTTGVASVPGLWYQKVLYSAVRFEYSPGVQLLMDIDKCIYQSTSLLSLILF